MEALSQQFYRSERGQPEAMMTSPSGFYFDGVLASLQWPPEALGDVDTDT